MVKKTTLYNSENEKLYPRTSAECVGYGDGTVKDALDSTGVGGYPAFSASTVYSAGDVVNYNGKLYKFTADHAAGAWTGSDVEETDVVKAHIVQELGDSEDNVMSQGAVTEEINKKLNRQNDSETAISDKSAVLKILDDNGNVVFLINSNGVNSLKYNICNSQGNIVGMIDKKFVDKFSDFDPHEVKDSIDDLSKSKVDKSNESETTLEDTSSNYRIVDANGNVVLMLDSQGLKAAKFLRCGPNGNIIEELVNKDDSGEDITKKTKIEYHAGKEYTFGQTLEASSGVTTSINTSLIRHGEFSIKADILNTDDENYIIIPLEQSSISNEPFGFWMWINPFDQLNIDNFKAQIVNDSGYVQAQIYSFGNALYSNNSTLSSKQINTLGGWIYITIFGNAGTKLKLIFKSTSVGNNEKIATIYVDGQYYIGKKITPVFVINGDGFYNNEAALGIYEYIESNGLVHSVCGTYSESEQMPDLMKTQISKGILEMGAYGGQDGQVIAKGTDYATMITSCQKIIGIDSQETEQRIPPILYGCQFHKLTPLIFRVVTDCGFKLIKGGGFGYYNNSFQQIFDHAEHTPIAIMPTGFTGSGNGAEFLKQQARNWIDRTINCGTLGVLFNHNYSENPAQESDSSLYTYTEVMRYIIDYLAEQKAAGKCLVLKPTELYENLVTL